MISNGRKYRSKKERPCDLCRSRKIQCKLEKDAEACEICQKLGRSCTFVLAPLRRKHPRPPSNGTSPRGAELEGPLVAQRQSVTPPQGFTDMEPPGSWWPVDGEDTLFPGNEFLTDDYPAEMVLQEGTEPVPEPAECSQDISLSNGLNPPDWPGEYSLEARQGWSNELIGLSSESDPYLLRHYPYHKHDTYTMFRLDFRKMTDESNGTDSQIPGPMPIQFVMTNEDIYKDGVKAAEGFSGSSESSDLDLLNDLVPADLGSRLVKLYTRHVHPHFPVLSLANIKQIQSLTPDIKSIGLRSAVYALAAPFAFLDDELSLSRGYLRVPTEDLWAIAHRSFHRASHLSHISLLQLSLLLLHKPPAHWAVADPPGIWALSSSSVAIAESLGLTLDPCQWRLPREEILLRRRLWWLTFTQHTWQALVMGRASHINPENWDVSEPTTADFEAPNDLHDLGPNAANAIVRNIPICLAQCQLSIIVSDMLREFYTLKAVRHSPPLETLLSRAQPLRTRIESWRQTLHYLSKPASELTEDEFELSASLRISHLTLEILIYRALLRPLVPSAIQGEKEPVSTILENSYTCAKVGTEMVSALKARNFACFWPSYTRNQLCYISTFILLNLAQSPNREIAIRNRDLLNKWRDILRTQSQAWPVARLATIRLDAVFWKGLSTVVQGMGESPVNMVLE